MRLSVPAQNAHDTETSAQNVCDTETIVRYCSVNTLKFNE